MSREATLAAIRRNRPKGDFPLPPIPAFAPAVDGDLIAVFAERLKRMGGRFEPSEGGDPLAPVRARLASAGIVASAVPEIAGNRDLTSVATPADLEDVDVAIVRAAFGIAESGSVLFTERQLIVNAVAYLAQHLIVLLDPADIVDTVQSAYRRPEFAEAAYAVLHTGPSATADIEGVLIHGAQGVRSLTVVPVARRG